MELTNKRRKILIFSTLLVTVLFLASFAWMIIIQQTFFADVNPDTDEFIVSNSQLIVPNQKGMNSINLKNNMAVWDDRRNACLCHANCSGMTQTADWDIYAYNFASFQEIPIETICPNQNDPSFDGNFIVWIDLRNDNYREVFLYKMSDGSIANITPNETVLKYKPIVQYPYIAWQEDLVTSLKMYLYNDSTKVKKLLSEERIMNKFFDGDYIVYTTRVNDIDLINLYKLSSDELTTLQDVHGIVNGIYASKIIYGVWEQGAGKYKLKAYDMTEKKKYDLKDYFSDYLDAKNDGNLLIYPSPRTTPYGYDLKVFDLNYFNKQTIYSVGDIINEVAIDNNRIIWNESSSGIKTLTLANNPHFVGTDLTEEYLDTGITPSVTPSITPSPIPSITPTPTPTPASQSVMIKVVKIHANARGKDSKNLNDEYIKIKNNGNISINLKNVRVKNKKKISHRLAPYMLAPGKIATIRTGRWPKGLRKCRLKCTYKIIGGNLYLHHKKTEMWHNRHDTIKIYYKNTLKISKKY